MKETIVISKAYNVRITAILIGPASLSGLMTNLFSKFKCHMYFFAKIKENENIVDFTETFGTIF